MSSPASTRRAFLATAATATAAAFLPSALRAASAAASTPWTIGCFNRPWTKWSFDETLDAVKGAGYQVTGLLTETKDDPFIAARATPEYLAALKQKLSSRGLRANMGALRVKNDAPLAEAVADVRQQITNAQTLGLEYTLTFGVDDPKHYAQYYRVMADAAAFARDRGVKLVLKPHGGGSGAAEEILRCIKEVAQPNFKIWYDAGNIIHYTGKDPVAELAPIAEHVTGFCAKDCGSLKGDVMVQFGTGKVDFAGVFRRLKSAGFNGPIMVEGCAVGDTPAATMANARANRLFLEKVLAAI